MELAIDALRLKNDRKLSLAKSRLPRKIFTL